MTCGVFGCPRRPRGRFVSREGGKPIVQDDPLCPDHAALASARAQATLATTGRTGFERESRWLAAWGRVEKAGLPLPEIKALPEYARLDVRESSERAEKRRKRAGLLRGML